jgi:SAM-dependent methyltransferase
MRAATGDRRSTLHPLIHDCATEMNWAHRRVCGSRYWRRTVHDRLLPWVLASLPPAQHTLEVGPGPGATTEILVQRTRELTCVEIDGEYAARLAARYGSRVRVLCEDAAVMSIASDSCDLAVAIAVLHHVPSVSRQDEVLLEIARALRPGGVLAGYEITASLPVRCLHWLDTLTLISPAGLPARLADAGLVEIEVETGPGGFRFRAKKPGRASARRVRPRPQHLN